MTKFGWPKKQGLYDPEREHDSCGTGFVVDIQGRQSHDIVQKAIEVLLNLEHRGACGSERTQAMAPASCFRFPTNSLCRMRKAADSSAIAGQYAVGVVFLPTEERSGTSVNNYSKRCVEEASVLGWRTVPTQNERWEQLPALAACDS